MTGRLVRLLLLLVLTAFPPSQALAESSASAKQAWMRVEITVVPLRSNTVRDGEILGYARKGDVLAVEKEGNNWVRLRANDTLSGWVPRSLVSPSGPPVHYDTGAIKWTLLVLILLGLGAFLFVGVRLYLTRKAESLERSRQALADARRRLQNKIQILFRNEPRIPSHLVMDAVDLAEFLRNIGYVANLEKDPAHFLASCKAFKPNLILAASEFRDQVEALVETDALLINTPIIYLHCEQIPASDGSRIRAHLEPNATDKDLGEAIAQCLKRSPDRIRYSVKPVALKGEIRGGTLVELLHFLATVKRSGQLLAVHGAERGEVLLHKGEIVKAAMKGLTGARATEQVLNLGAGTFEFHERGTQPTAESINTQKLLLDWAKTQDENHHRPRT
jgi:hypothetical protein